jgi:hypothetical protein
LAEWKKKKLNGLTHTKLRNMCEERQLKPGSTKDICITRLMGGDDKSAKAKAAPGADGAGAKRDGEGAGGGSKAKKQKGGADAKSSNSKRAGGPLPEPGTKKQCGGTHKAPQRMSQVEAGTDSVPTTHWGEIKPTRSCSAELKENKAIRGKLRLAETIASDVDAKALDIPWSEPPPPVTLQANELCAIIAYTHDTMTGNPRDNLYFQLNEQLRKRDLAARSEMMSAWGPFVHFLLKGMSKLPDHEGTVYRGYPNKAETLKQYKKGRPIQWGAFSSTSKSFDATKGFTDQKKGVIFKIEVFSGKDINAYSFFPCEDEILLSPSHRFLVTSHPYEQDGYTVVDMMEQTGSAWIS